MDKNDFESQSPELLDRIDLSDNDWVGYKLPLSDDDKRRLNSRLFERAMKLVNTFGATEDELDQLSYWSDF
jgi:hypothetical protein